LGGFSVRRALPDDRRQMVGPFIFYDHFGPVQFAPGQGIDVRPHPHIGLATVTYLFDGRILHRDSLANVQEIAPGAMNLMTAGRGIVHSERTPPGPRAAGQQMLGVQSWLALPLAHEETEPSFQHFSANVLPIVEDQGVFARVIAGAAFGATSPVETLSDWFYVELRLSAGASAPLDADYEQRALYLVEGAIEIAGERFGEPQLLIFSPGPAIAIRALVSARMMLLGGAPVDGRRFARLAGREVPFSAGRRGVHSAAGRLAAISRRPSGARRLIYVVNSTIHSPPDEQIIRRLCLKPLSRMAIGFSFGKVETVERGAKARRCEVYKARSSKETKRL
ncbi:MAG: Pirin domain-containing protein, partial [Methylocystaceae bacterium]